MNDNIQPLVSVVTPVYNGGKFLDECIRSVLFQTYQNWEYIILNNSSTDNTLEIAEKYAAKDKRIRVYNTESLLPIMENWNHALSYLSLESKYCKVVHADDLLFSKCLEEMVSLAETYPAIGVVGSYGFWGGRVVCEGLPVSKKYLCGSELCRLTLLDRVYCFWSPSSLLIRSDLIKKKRPCFYPGSHLHADVEACYEILKESDFGFVHQILTFIRKHEESVTSVEAMPYNRSIVANLHLLIKYGPVFLSETEFLSQLNQKTREYYYFMANSLFELREIKFWRFHMDSLEAIGFPFRFPRLIHEAIRMMISNPSYTISTIFKSAKEKNLRFFPHFKLDEPVKSQKPDGE
jgi:glycosyltransferase involved in cell wall biosynthesis